MNNLLKKHLSGMFCIRIFCYALMFTMYFTKLQYEVPNGLYYLIGWIVFGEGLTLYSHYKQKENG